MNPQTAAMLGLSATCLVCAPGAARATAGFHFSETDISSEQIDRYVAPKHFHNRPVRPPPLAGNGASFVQQGRTYDVDPRLIAAIAGQESQFGWGLCAPYNAWNWFWGGRCERSPFESFERGTRTVTKFMRRSYLNKGYTTISLIGKKYCVDGCESWISGVTFFYRQMAQLKAPAPAEQPAPEPLPPTPAQETSPFVAPAPAATPPLLQPAPAVTPPMPAPAPLPQDIAPRHEAAPVLGSTADTGPSRTRMMVEGAAIGAAATGLLGGLIFLAFRLISRRHVAA